MPMSSSESTVFGFDGTNNYVVQSDDDNFWQIFLTNQGGIGIPIHTFTAADGVTLNATLSASAFDRATTTFALVFKMSNGSQKVIKIFFFFFKFYIKKKKFVVWMMIKMVSNCCPDGALL